MTERPFHHGNLRAALLDEAVTVLRSSGVDGLSLRDLARRVGVSHGAPRSHFVDRRALLDALAVQGFDRLRQRTREALAAGRDLPDRFHRVAQAYVDFAIDDAALMELMFQAKADGGGAAVQEAAGALFTELDQAMGPRRAATDTDTGGDRDAFKLLFAATMQGIAALVASHRIPRPEGDRLVDVAMTMMLGSELAARTIGDERS
ncbi:transcriptional regulator, TetR family [Curtobacterium sp. 314Chir4.1]|uniref:TetR/AcrR family transcriptional regulator n=1 Tax=Curtobacterium sp. 314Chir4.1 TaxID=1279028 RepID=UPI000BD1A1E0|nr:TetR/AcrR family transcriptional regulator [Curtobacterium sp. 314Chir4.1]SOC88073.1 transcriptional regulator, TetR family [Curtobacterium sp. 314Chir4.1]